MSISSAPAATAVRVSSSFAESGTRPAGKPLATDATLTPLPRRASTAKTTMFGYTQTAATCGTDGSPGWGWRAFRQSSRTVPSEAFPPSDGRTRIEVASLIPATLAAFLIERFPRLTALSSIPTASTRGTRERSKGSRKDGAVLMELLIIGAGKRSGFGAAGGRDLRRAQPFGTSQSSLTAG